MKRNKNIRITHYTPYSVRGFTLIEFLVASMLAMIVIVAASGTYMITRKLNTSAQERISVQQDIRNASVQMARDARMAGTFGCFNTGDNGIRNKEFQRIEAQNAVAKGLVFLDSTNDPSNPNVPKAKDGFGVRVVQKDALKDLSGLSGQSDGLLFIYGQSSTAVTIPETQLLTKERYTSDSKATTTVKDLERVFIKDESDVLKNALKNKGDIILSSCSEIVRVDVDSSTDEAVKIKDAEFRASTTQVGELSLSKLHASLYVLGDINRAAKQWDDEKALLRYDLGADGSWQNPQLLATGIKSMSFAFGYVNKTSDTCQAISNNETFSFFDTPINNTTGKQPPVLVQIRLKYYTNKATNDVKNTAQIRDYIINTTVRAGNTCVNRLVNS